MEYYNTGVGEIIFAQPIFECIFKFPHFPPISMLNGAQIYAFRISEYFFADARTPHRSSILKFGGGGAPVLKHRPADGEYLFAKAGVKKEKQNTFLRDGCILADPAFLGQLNSWGRAPSTKREAATHRD